ncbi:MAG: nucleoside deaminase [Gammaproteobacteria bacterium]
MISTFKSKLHHYKEQNKLNAFELIACAALEQAIVALSKNNFGVGAAIATIEGKLLVTGRNHVFNPQFNSSLHAEMDALNNFENSIYHSQYEPNELMLITTLEPCMMCMGRTLMSSIKHIYWLSDDQGGGAARLLSHLPEVFYMLQQMKRFEPAICSDFLKQLANHVFCHNAAELCKKFGIECEI